jgi:hypothetical protein
LLLLHLTAVLGLQVGAKLVPVQLQPPNWDILRQQLEAAFSDKTKFILVNTPHNPTGKVSTATTQGEPTPGEWHRRQTSDIRAACAVPNAHVLAHQHCGRRLHIFFLQEVVVLHLQVFTREELQVIADLCLRHNTYAVADEVYEHLVFEPHQHVSLRTLPGMADRTIRLGSAGKTFSFTAWKVSAV